MEALPLDLTYEEIKRITGYSRPAYQLRVLKELHIPARKRPDNTVLVLRMHCTTPAMQQAANDVPQLKSSRK